MLVCQMVPEYAGSTTCEEAGSTAFLRNLWSSLGQLQDTNSSQGLKIGLSVMDRSAGKIRCLWTPLNEQP